MPYGSFIYCSCLSLCDDEDGEPTQQILLYKELGDMVDAAGLMAESRGDWSTAERMWQELEGEAVGMEKRFTTLTVSVVMQKML